MTYAVVGFLTALQVVTWFGWFICEIIIHSLNRDSTLGTYQQMLSQQSMQIYQYEGVIMAGSLAALHLAASVKTRAARVASFVVQMFAFLAWFWELYFIIPTFFSHSNPSNLFCTNTTPFINTIPITNGVTQTYIAYFPEISICRLAMAVASFAVIMQAWEGLILVYSFANIFIAPMLEDGTRKEIIEEDDAEVATVVAANPAGYEGVNARVRMWSTLSLLLTALSLTGYALFMYSLIDVVRNTQFNLNQNLSQYGTANLTQLGDFVISVNFRQLSLTLVFALAASGYAAFRHNRGIQAGALFLTTITMLQWWSFIIFSGRFLRQYQNGAANVPDSGGSTTGNPSFNNIGYPALDAQKAMYAGACVILAGETLRTFALLGRYFSYVPVTRNNIIPTYIRGAFATANPIPVMLFWFEVLVTLAWWVLQFVSESDSGIFSDVPGGPQGPNGSVVAPYFVPLQNVVTETLFIWQTMYIVAVFLPELFSERTKTLASKQAAFAVNITIMSAYFLLSWPWAYAGSHKNGGYWESGSIYAAGNTGAATPGFCNQAAENWGHDNCYFMQGASILSFIGGLGFVLLAIWQAIRILSIFPTPGQVATIDGTVVDALPPNVGIQKALGWTSSLLLIGLLIWALTAIDAGSGFYGWQAWTFGQLPSTPGWQDPANGFYQALTTQWQTILSYTYSVAFGDLVIIAFTVWAAEEMASNPVVANWHAWRTLVTGLSGLLFSFFLPQFILVCRFINWGPLDAIGKGIASGFIIMCIGDFALYSCALSAQRSPLIALPAAINNTAAPVGTGVKGAPMNEVVVDTTKPGNPVVGTAAGQNATYGNAYSEPTVTSTENPVPTRDYSGNQQVPV